MDLQTAFDRLREASKEFGEDLSCSIRYTDGMACYADGTPERAVKWYALVKVLDQFITGDGLTAGEATANCIAKVASIYSREFAHEHKGQA